MKHTSFTTTCTRHIAQNKRSWTRGMSAVLAGCFVVYAFLVVHTVMITRDYKSLDKQMTDMRDQVAKLQANYFALTMPLDHTYALDNGFIDASHPLFVTLNADTMSHDAFALGTARTIR